MEYSDSEVIRLIRINDQSALSFLYKKHYGMVNHFILNNNGSDDDAKDIFQEGMIVFYEKLQMPEFELSCQIKTFLYAICRRMWLKKLIHRSKFIGKINDNEEIAEIADEEISQIDKKENDITSMNLALNKLGEPCTTIITDYYIQNLSMENICEKFGYTNADNAKNQKYKCLTRLKKIFFAGNKN